MERTIERNGQKKSYVRIAILCICCMIGTLLPSIRVEASSCNIILCMEEETVTEGTEFVVTVSVDAEENISGIEMMLTYDSDYLELVTASPQVSGEEGTLKISELDMATERDSVRYMIKFKLQKVGASYIKVSSNPSVYNESSGQSMSVASNVLTVVGVAQKTASSNSDLKSLKINGGTLKPEFSKDVYEYTVKVEEGVEKLFISAEAEDKNATVKVEGAESLVPGENDVFIIVTAENGDTTKYKIIATYESVDSKEGKPEEAVTEEPQGGVATGEIDLAPITINQVEEKELITTYGVYTIETVTPEVVIPSGYTSTSVTIDGVAITAYENMEQRNDFVLIYASREGTEPTFYQYDKKEQTLQRANLLLILEEAKDVNENEAFATSTKQSMLYDILLIVLFVLCMLFMVTTALLYRKVQFYEKKRKNRH